MTFQETLSVRTTGRLGLVDLTSRVRQVVGNSGIKTGLCHIFVTGATAAILINENDDPQLIDDVLDALDRLIPEGRWRHDRIDDNGAAHIKSAALGPSETVPVMAGDLALGTWQNIFLGEFDGPRSSRRILVTVHGE
jgi:secondary thiamine-phosphate synthase enzyme